MATTSTSNTSVVLAAIDAINAHDLEALREFWTEDVWERFPDETVHGRDALAAYFGERFAAMPDLHIEPLHTAEQGDSVFLRWKLTGTHSGAPFQGLNVTGKRIEMDGMDHFTVREGRIVSNFVVFDQLEVGRSLGLMPPDGSPAEKAMKAGFNAVLAVKARVKR
jgi:steroid delta-isomerase-like uncharacterized protein